MADEKPKTVKVIALQHHSYNGKDYAPGDTYDIDEQVVTSVIAQGKAAPSDPAAVAPPAAKDAAKPVKAGKAAKAKRGRK